MNQLLFSLIFLVALGGCQTAPETVTPSANSVAPAPLPLPQVHGHRGSRGTHPENTLPAFEEALNSGAQFIELDLVLSKEGIPVVSHDPVISADSCLDKNKKPLSSLAPIRKLTLSQIKSYDCGSVPNPRFPEQKPIPNTQIPTLEEVLVWLNKTPNKQVQLNIETKMPAPQKALDPMPRKFATVVIQLLRKHGWVEKTVLQSFDFRTLQVANKMEPKLRLSALFENKSDFCQTTKELGAVIASPQFSWLTPESVKECHSMGIQLHPWTLNDEGDWKKAIQMGVDGIITDYPRKLISYLQLRK